MRGEQDFWYQYQYTGTGHEEHASYEIGFTLNDVLFHFVANTAVGLAHKL